VTAALFTDERDDATLALAAAAGDRAAFAAIYDRYADRLHDFCIGMLRDREAAADCVQDVFVTAATKLNQLREPDRLRSWLYAIARSEALTRIRHRRREQPSEEFPEMASAEPELATLAARTELVDLIDDASGGLSDRDRTVLELAYRQDLSGPQLAEALGVTNKNANHLVERLRDTIARSLGALLVCRRVKADPGRCPELAVLLNDWDGNFTVLMRKRAARHIDECPACEDSRARMVTPAALLGATPVVIPAPAWLRDATLAKAPLSSTVSPNAESWWPDSDFNVSDLVETAPAATTRRRARIGVGAGLLLIGIAAGALIAAPPTVRMVPTDAPGGPAPTTTLPTTPSVAQRQAPPSIPPTTTALTSTPEFTAPATTESAPDEPSAQPRTTRDGPTSRVPQSEAPVPEPQNPQPEPEPEETSQPQPTKKVTQEPKVVTPEQGPSEEPTQPKKQPTVPKVTPPKTQCTPENPCGPVFS
jgi:RNA polymerase sigma factor (sigma-70 family)